MSRHGARAGRGLGVFQLEILDYSRRSTDHYETITTQRYMPRDGNGRDKHKVTTKLDLMPDVPHRTILGRFKDSNAAKRWGRRFGTIVSCQKVDTMPYLRNIEFLNLETHVEIQVAQDEFVINKALELTRPRKEPEQRIQIVP